MRLLDGRAACLVLALVGREIAATKGNALVLLHHYGRCATREVSAVFGVTDDESSLLLEELEADGKVYRREVGKGVMWELPTGRI